MAGLCQVSVPQNQSHQAAPNQPDLLALGAWMVDGDKYHRPVS